MPRISQGYIKDRFFFAYSQIGCDHIERDMPNQDHYAYSYSDHTACFAVSDGLGSCRFSGIGSETASSQVVTAMARFPENKGSEVDILSAFEQAIENIRHRLDEQASAANAHATTPVSREDYAATLIFAMIRHSRLFVAQIGDGAIFAVSDRGAERLLPPTKGVLSNETVPITLPNWRQHLKYRFIDLTPDDRFICLMTDGFADPIVNPNLIMQRISDALQIENRDELPQWVDSMNDYFEQNGYSSDDKTLLIVLLWQDRDREVR